MKKKFVNFLILFLLTLVTVVNSQDKQQVDLEKAIQNPIANIVSMPFQDNIDFGLYDTLSLTKNTLNFQPVFPFSLGKSVNLITRTIIPLITQPVPNSSSVTGLGDITLSTFFSPAKPGFLIWGVGAALGFPTATDPILGSKKWTAGPALIALVQPKGWTMGFLAQNTWSYAGDEYRGDVNYFYSNVFIVKNLPDGWYINTVPIITANWKAESGEQWTVPLGLGVGKLVKFGGKLPCNLYAGYYNYVVKPTGSAKWQLRLQATFILPKFY